MTALRNTIAWTLALLWSTHKRSYQATCVTGVAFVFSPTLGSLFERNVNRMVGVALGLVIGELPALIMIHHEACGKHPSCLIYWPQGLFVYVAFMYLMWLFSMYGYLATRTSVGTRWELACILLAGYAGTRLLSNLREYTSQQAMDAWAFETIMDNFLGCILVFGTDILFAWMASVRTTDLVAEGVPKCLEDMGDLIAEIRRGDFRLASCPNSKRDCVLGNPGLLKIQKRIAQARSDHAEVQKQDLVFNSFQNLPYKADLVGALLDRFDNVVVALFGLLAAVGRCSSSQEAAQILNTVLPRTLAERCHLRAHAVRAALSERSKIIAAERARLDSGDRGNMNSRISMPTLDESGSDPEELPASSIGTPESISSWRPPGLRRSCTAQTRRSSGGQPHPIPLSRATSFPAETVHTTVKKDDDGRNELSIRALRVARTMVFEGQNNEQSGGQTSSEDPSALSTCRDRRQVLAAPAGSNRSNVVETADRHALKAAEVSLRTHAWALRLALQQVHVLLLEQVFWFAVDMTDSTANVDDGESLSLSHSLLDDDFMSAMSGMDNCTNHRPT